MGALALEARGLSKTFVLSARGPARLLALPETSLQVLPGHCLAVNGPSGAGKSTLLRCLYGNYAASTGEIWARDGERRVDVARATPREILRLRERVFSYVSQFLRVIPRVSALDIVAAPRLAGGDSKEAALARAADILRRLNVPEKLWALPPHTFSGGEKQRVNIARGFREEAPIWLLDEPTASLDSLNRQVVVELILEAKARGAAIVGVFHDREVREAVADSVLALAPVEAREDGAKGPASEGPLAGWV
ncbi:MAG: phosphonate C-P lyase system protein PhnL [Deltaproteobacteria bacterium]|jgi:alpha-D-ribose 1-methylphosphonate 5-triphosphate synthase subunit PhnL|nr:phosphonate C-P lyase system protein PhnL [Deltaproteobacteria bacterium]